MFLVNYPGVYGIEHILYLAICIILMVIGVINTKRVQNDENKMTVIMRITGIILLCVILTNRISVTYYDVVVNKREGYSWLNLLPYTVCGTSSFIYSFALIFGKKDNNVLHFISYLGFFGGILTICYPDFLESQTFFDIRSFTGLLHHTIMVYATIVCIATGYLKPRFSKFINYPIGLSFLMIYGLFLKDALHFPKSMMIGDPLLKSIPVISSWYFVGTVSIILLIIFLYLYKQIKNKNKVIK